MIALLNNKWNLLYSAVQLVTAKSLHRNLQAGRPNTNDMKKLDKIIALNNHR